MMDLLAGSFCSEPQEDRHPPRVGRRLLAPPVEAGHLPGF